LVSNHSPALPQTLRELDDLIETLEGKTSLREVPLQERWRIRSTIFQLELLLQKQRPTRPGLGGSELERPREELREAIEYFPIWVVVGVALCLGVGTTIGYRRIVVTVAEKIGKTHLTYAQGACAEVVAMATIGLADVAGLPVSTTHVLSSGIAGAMWANESGIQMATIRKIGLAWILTLPAAMLLSAGLYLFGHLALGQ
jgi:phosphate/sulfate permease